MSEIKTFNELFAIRERALENMEKHLNQSFEEFQEKNKRARFLEDGLLDLEDFTADDNLIKKWGDFGCLTQDAYPEYHTAGMLVAFSHLFPSIMTPQYSQKGVGNNMWVIILGNSGCGKSTACGALNTVLNDPRVSPYVCRLSNKFTPEALTISLSEGARRFHYSNECAGFMKNMKRDYASELPDDLTNAYDNERVSKQTVKMGIIECKTPVYSGLWNTTIDAWSKNATMGNFESGMFLRPVYIISTREKPLMRDQAMSPQMIKTYDTFMTGLVELLQLVHGSPSEDGRVAGTRKIIFSESEILNNWKHDLRTMTNNGEEYSELQKSALQRVFDQSRKLAMNLTISSRWFRDYVKTYPRYAGNLPTDENTAIQCSIPDDIAEVACHIAETVFWKNTIKAAKLTMGNSSPGMKRVLNAMCDGNKHTRTELGEIAGVKGGKLDNILDNLILKSASITVPGACKPTWFYWMEI